ncbi:MAG: peptidylprolyl isomerase [Saprospiraceae bacterium]|nr:peptidylprolyl isomerase [Saprospiraceae bacterium]
MLKNIVLAGIVLLLLTQCQQGNQEVLIETSMGDMRVELFNSTPKHRDNFIKLAKDEYFDGLLFHRIIKGFMIQGGDPDSRDAPAHQMLGQGGPGYQIDAEIGALHYKGALSAARLADGVNPEKKSSGSQFYIVQGFAVKEQDLAQASQRTGIQYTNEQKERYFQEGGYPFLDGDYTVFGQVVEGLDVIDKLSEVQTGQADRPIEDLEMKITVL